MSDIFHAGLRDAVAEARGASGVPAPRPRLPARRLATPPVHRPPVPASELKVAKRTVLTLWLPLTPLWVLLAPFALLLTPLLYLAPEKDRVPPFRTITTLGAVLLTMSGTKVDVDTPDALVRIRIF
ncbi:MAG TPA: hypothetical protein VGL58_20200 [Caulobacteraceae bacterium]|jgi:hypothetical protein